MLACNLSTIPRSYLETRGKCSDLPKLNLHENYHADIFWRLLDAREVLRAVDKQEQGPTR